MIHHSIKNAKALNSSEHWAVSTNGNGEVLVQIDDGEQQARIRLTSLEVLDLMMVLDHHYERAIIEQCRDIEKKRADELEKEKGLTNFMK